MAPNWCETLEEKGFMKEMIKYKKTTRSPKTKRTRRPPVNRITLIKREIQQQNYSRKAILELPSNLAK